MSHLDVPSIKVNAERCKKDGLCVPICPLRIFTMAEGEFPVTRHNEECVLCGQCISACPNHAVEHSGFDMQRFRAIRNRAPVAPEDAYEFLTQRRSVRQYKKEVPPRELLAKVIEVAGYSPNSPHHRNGWLREFVVVSGAENMKTVLDMTVDYVRKTSALLDGFLVRTVSKFDAGARAGREVLPSLNLLLAEYDAGRDMVIYGAPVALFAIAPADSSTPQIDCDSAMLTVMYYAHAHGLGTCWNGLLQGAAAGDHLHGFTCLSEFLKIPKGYKCYAAATVGFPAVRLHSVPQREVGITWIG
jgi:NAD-dependent dihydropyrimidine dehydrogenase PreA subunit/nitroreductase